ncbi:hypothetical protein EV363DRAFT_1559012 [Boletus edulis]|nr:hypothetical protein EV363DRAFT_1559012 [Boletus edulis]
MQIRSLGLTEVSKRNVNVFEVGLTLDEFCTQYGEPMAKMGVMDGSAKEKVEQTGNVLGLQETDIVLGQYKVFLSQAAFHSLEDRLRDPYAPYASPGLPPDDYADPYNQVSSQAHVPLVANPSPFQRGNLYKDDYEDQTNSNYGSESYAPSRNMFQNADKEGLIAKEALAGEIMENETTGVIKETSARRRWVLLCWLLTWWIPSIFLKWFGRMKREDVRQAWREKFALNVIIWFICACAVFVIAVLGVVICPTEHVFSTSELASHSFSNSANNVYTAIRGEVFDLMQVAASSGDPAVLKPVWLAMRSPATTGKETKGRKGVAGLNPQELAEPKEGIGSSNASRNSTTGICKRMGDQVFNTNRNAYRLDVQAPTPTTEYKKLLEFCQKATD